MLNTYVCIVSERSVNCNSSKLITLKISSPAPRTNLGNLDDVCCSISVARFLSLDPDHPKWLTEISN